MNKTIWLLVMFLLITVVPSFAYEAEIYEKDGCVYIVGHLTKEEKTEQSRVYKERMNERGKQINAEIQRDHEIEIEKIRAQAMRDYLIAQSLPIREIANAIRNIKPARTCINIGDITSESNSLVEDVNSFATGGTGGQVTNTTNNDNTNTNTNINENETDIDVSIK